jgi:glycerol-3-phosphate acyltransferase PlsY
LERCLKVCVWLSVLELAGHNKLGDAGPDFATFVMAREQRVFAVKGDGTNGALDDVAVHLDGAVIGEQLKASHIFAIWLGFSPRGPIACPTGSIPVFSIIALPPLVTLFIVCTLIIASIEQIIPLRQLIPIPTLFKLRLI